MFSRGQTRKWKKSSKLRIHPKSAARGNELARLPRSAATSGAEWRGTRRAQFEHEVRQGLRPSSDRPEGFLAAQQGTRIGMTLFEPSLVLSFKGTPGFIPTFPTEHQQVSSSTC